VAEPWLEMELARQLRPVAAPESLWDRIEGRRAPEQASFQWMSWPVAAALMLTVAGGVAWRVAVAHDPGIGVRALAVEELRRLEGGRLDFRSDDPREIQRWVKATADIDIDLLGSSEVRLLGARMIEGQGRPVAAVDYRVGEGTAALLVSGRGGGDRKAPHVFAPVASVGDARVYSWKMRDQEYAIAASVTRDPNVACLLCHSQLGVFGGKS
jgi:hypothetical protein